MKRWIYGLAAVCVGISLGVVLWPKAQDVEVYPVVPGLFEETFSAEGRFQARNTQTLYARATGDLIEVHVQKGTRVAKGDILAKLRWDRVDRILSPETGVLTRVYRDSPGPVSRGEPLFEVAGLDSLEVIVDLLTTDAVKLTPGLPVRIAHWGGSSMLDGVVKQVSKSADITVSALGVEEERTKVRVSLPKLPEDLRQRLGHQYHVGVTFIVSREEQAISIPLGALVADQEGFVVYVVEQGRARRVGVTVSKRAQSRARIDQGLKEGDQVIVFPGDKVTDGVRVKPQMWESSP